MFDLELKPCQHLFIFTLALNTAHEMLMLALLPELGIRETRRVKATESVLESFHSPRGAKATDSPLSGMEECLRSCLFGLIFLLLSHCSLGRCTELLKQRL